MTYTISTKPVTREHINRKVLVRDHEDYPWEGPYILNNVTVDDDFNTVFIVDEWKYPPTQALLIVDDPQQ